MSAQLPAPSAGSPQSDATLKALVQTNPVRYARAAMSQPVQDTLGRITGDPNAAGPGA